MLRVRHSRIYRLASGRYRCGRCRYTFGLFTGTWLGQARVSLTTWVWLIKLFELEVTARQGRHPTQRELSDGPGRLYDYPASVVGPGATGPLAVGGRSRRILLWQAPQGPPGAGPPAGKVPVFGILERRGRVAVTVVRDVSANTLLQETVKVVKRGALVYTDKFGGYDALTFCGYRHLTVNHSTRFSRGRVHINGLEGFWSYAKGKLLKHHGVSPIRFPLYLYEMQFRYNHRHQDLFTLFLDALVRPVQIFDNHHEECRRERRRRARHRVLLRIMST